MGVVDDAVEDGVGVGWVTDDLVPFVDRRAYRHRVVRSAASSSSQ